MKNFLRLTRHELWCLCIAPSTYAAAVLFLLIMGLVYMLSLEDVSLAPRPDLPSTTFYSVFWLPVLFMVPLLTMRSIAEERRQGTLEAALTTPVSAVQIVFSKFTAAYVFYLLLWALTLLFPWIAQSALGVKGDARLLESAPLIGGMSFVAISGLLYVAVGIFASSLTRTTLVAGMLSFSMLFILILAGGLIAKPLLMNIQLADWIRTPMEYLQSFRHLEDFTRGMLDSRPLVLYLSNALLLLGVTSLVVESKS